MRANTRGVSSVVGVVLMVAVVVIVGTLVASFAYGFSDSTQADAPRISVSYETVDAGDEQSIAVTLEAGEAVRTNNLYVVASKDIDIGGSPVIAQESNASGLEKFTESSGSNPPQVGIGDTWEAGETVYLDPVGSAEGVTIGIYWNTQSVEGVNPGSVEGQDAYKIAEFTV